MKIADHIRNRGDKTLFSFEILPPVKGDDITSIFDTIEDLMEFRPSFIDVTAHREDFVLKEQQDGSLKKYCTRKRPGTVAICGAIQSKFGVDAVPHLLCGGFTKEETEYALIDLHFLGIDNVLALRGDTRHGEKSFVPEPNGHGDSLSLMGQIRNHNGGVFLDPDVKGAKSNFCYGGACYPEKFLESPNFEMDLEWMKKKEEAGCEYFVTQMFFDNSKYWSFVQMAREYGIQSPIIPGLKPLTTKGQIWSIPKLFGCHIPKGLSDSILSAGTKEEVFEAGIDWAVKQCEDLISGGAPVLHFYTMSKSKATRSVCEKIFK